MIYVSVIVTEQSHLLENTLVRLDLPLEKEEATAYRAELEEWLEMRPIPGQPKYEVIVDQASLLALELPHILHKRDSRVFGRYYIDPEGDLSHIEKRPYDWTRSEVI